MSASKPTECFHRITQFQAHRCCHLLASICEKECQQVHKTDKDQILIVSLQVVQQQYKTIIEILATQRKKYRNEIIEIYQSIVKQIQKHMENNVKQMEAEIQSEMLKSLTIEKTLFEKLQNKRYERVKCYELISMIEQTHPQQKIKKSALINIYQKYKNQTNKFRESLFQGKPISPLPNTQKKLLQNKSPIVQQKQPVQVSKQKTISTNIKTVDNSSSLANNNKYQGLYLQKNRELKQLQQINEKLKYEKKVLATEKSNLQREISKLHFLKVNNKKKKLILKTWNIAQVITKKIKRVRNENQNIQVQSQNKANTSVDVQKEPMNIQKEPVNVQREERMVIQEQQSQPNQHLQSNNKPNIQSVIENNHHPIQNQQNKSNEPLKDKPQQKQMILDQDEQEDQSFLAFLRKRKLA